MDPAFKIGRARGQNPNKTVMGEGGRAQSETCERGPGVQGGTHIFFKEFALRESILST